MSVPKRQCTSIPGSGSSFIKGYMSLYISHPLGSFRSLQVYLKNSGFKVMTFYNSKLKKKTSCLITENLANKNIQPFFVFIALQFINCIENRSTVPVCSFLGFASTHCKFSIICYSILLKFEFETQFSSLIHSHYKSVICCLYTCIDVDDIVDKNLSSM